MRKVFRVLLYILGILVLLAASFLIYVHIDSGVLADVSHLEDLINSLTPRSVKVEGVPLYTQPDGYSCGAATISAMVSYVTGQELSPQDFIEKYSLTGGMYFETFVEILTDELPGYRIQYRHDLNDTELIQEIHKQLNRGLPAPIFFGAANPYNEPYYDFHASVVTGMDLDKRQVEILNVYGYEERIGLTEFLNRMSYRPISKFPLMQRIILKLGLIDRNTYFLLEAD